MEIVGTGVDLVSAERIGRALARRKGFLTRIYTPAERRACQVGSQRTRLARLASRFAAKEAFYKALGAHQRGLSWKDAEVTGGGRAAPALKVSKKAQAALERAGARRVHLSLSHEAGLAVAVVILEG